MKPVLPLANQEGSFQQEDLEFWIKKKEKSKKICSIKTGRKTEGSDLFKECVDLCIMTFILQADVREF